MEKISADLNSGKCKYCGGSGWIITQEVIPEYDSVPIDMARPCTACAGSRRWQDETGIPLMFCEADLSKFNFDLYGCDMSKFKEVVTYYCDNYPEFENRGMGLYFASKTPGSGKTFLACCIARSIMFRYDIQMRFITAVDYLSLVGDSYKREPGEVDKSEVYRRCDLLVLDDLGAQKSGNWQDQELFQLVNTRLTTGKPMIITSNYSQDDTKGLKIGAPTVDRIVQVTFPMALPEVSIRRKKATDGQQRIMSEIFNRKKKESYEDGTLDFG